MGILDTLLSGQNVQLVTQLAKNSGIDQLIGTLSKGNHQHYLDNPQSLADASAVN